MSKNAKLQKFIKTGFTPLCILFVTLTIGRYINLLYFRPELYPSGDQLIWIKEVLIPLREQKIGLLQAISYEYDVLGHSHIPQLLWMVINERFFALELRLDLIIGFLAACITFVIILRFLKRSASLQPVIWLALTAISSIIFSTANGSSFSWSILLFQFFGVMLAIIFLYNLYALHHGVFWKLALATVLILLFSGPVGIAAVVCSAIFSLFFAAIDKSKRVKGWANCLFIALCIVALGNIFEGGRTHSTVGVSDLLAYIAGNPYDAFKGAANALSQVLVHERGAKPPIYFPYMPSYLIGMGVTLLAFCGLAFASFDIYRMNKIKLEKLMFPMSLILTGLIVIAGTLKSRLPVTNPDYILAPRYFTNFSILGLGIILLLALWAIEKNGKACKIIVSTLFMVVMFFNWQASAQTLTNVSYTNKFIAQRVDAMRDWNTIGLETVGPLVGGPCNNPSICKEVLEYMDDNNLSIFRKNDDHFPVLQTTK